MPPGWSVEPNDYRRGLSAELGAVAAAPTEDVVSLCRELAGSRGGFDVAFEVSGAAGVHPGLIDCLRREAVLVTITHPNGEVALDLGMTLNKKGITLRGIFGRRLWSSWERLLLMLDAGTLDLSTMVTHRLPLAEIEEAMALLSGRANKVLLPPSLD